MDGNKYFYYINETEDKVVVFNTTTVHKEVYSLNPDGTLGDFIADLGPYTSASYVYAISSYVGNNSYVDGNGDIYTFNEETNTFEVTYTGLTKVPGDGFDSDYKPYYKKNNRIVAIGGVANSKKGFEYDGNFYLFNKDLGVASNRVLQGTDNVRDGYGNLVVGTMTNQGNKIITPSTNTQTFSAGYYNGLTVNAVPLQDKSTDPSASVINIIPDENYLGLNQVTINAVNASIDANITPSNIANGVNILGVVGTLIPGEDLNNELNAQNLVIANLENQIDELSDIINNAGTGGNTINYITANYYEKAMLIGEAFVSSTGTTNDLYLLYSLKPDFSNTSAKLFGAAGAVRGALPAVELSDNRAINLSNAFLAYNNLVYGPNLTTQNVTDMSNMYQSCTKLITVANYNTINVTNMAFMFNNCLNLTSVPNFDTSNVINMGNMFNGWISNKTIPITSIPNFNTINVTDMSKMLRGTNITDLPNFDMSNVVEAPSMCTKCVHLVNIPDLNLPNIINTPDMFAGCTSLMNIPNIEMNQAINASSMFKDNPNLVNIGTINMANMRDVSQMFRNDFNLVNVPEFHLSDTTALLYSMFAGCNNLSNESVINIINMCINSNVPVAQKNLMTNSTFSPLYYTPFDNTYYQSKWTELTAAGWTY